MSFSTSTRLSVLRAVVFAAVALALGACTKPRGNAPMTMSFGKESSTLSAQYDLVDCGSDQFEFADSLRQLPGEIRNESGQRMIIADLGEPYNGGRGLDGLPGDRFAGAAIGRDHIFVVIEGDQTGVVYHDTIWVFERRGAQWLGRSKYGGGRNLKEILGMSCRQYSPYRHVSTVAGVQMTCDVNFIGRLVMLQYAAPGHAGNFAVRWSGQRQFDVESEPIEDFATHLPASTDAQADLRTTLQAVRPAMSQDDACGLQVYVFRKALGLSQ